MSSFRFRSELFPIFSFPHRRIALTAPSKVRSMTTMLASDLPLPRIGRGKVRDIYAVGDDRVLLLTTDRITVKAAKPTRMMFLGGDALEGPRHIWWNFVSSSKERIEQAKQDWKTGRFAPVPNEHEFIPLPE